MTITVRRDPQPLRLFGSSGKSEIVESILRTRPCIVINLDARVPQGVFSHASYVLQTESLLNSEQERDEVYQSILSTLRVQNELFTSIVGVILYSNLQWGQVGLFERHLQDLCKEYETQLLLACYIYSPLLNSRGEEYDRKDLHKPTLYRPS